MLKRAAAGVFRGVIVWPVTAAARLFGGRLWAPLEVAAALLGSAAGTACRPLARLAVGPGRPLQRLLWLTELVEGSLGIRGVDELLDDRTARRTVVFCPFAGSLRRTPELCLRLGDTAGKSAVAALAPGCRFEVKRALSQGQPCCEYLYQTPG